MKRSFGVLAAVFKDHKLVPSSANEMLNLITNFKEWKLKNPPNYASLPIHESPEYNVPVAVKDAVFSKVPVEPLTGKISLVCVSDDALSNILDLSPSVAESQDFVDWIAGQYHPEGALTVCHRYGGYQFGYWADQLGDGRAHTLGEYVNRKGESWQPQLKGSGETPYSRFGDGRAVLRSSVREMVCSEAAAGLGVPTTRAAGLVVSDTHQVWRDKSYTGAAKKEKAAVVLRLAPAWYRVGSLEILDKRKEHGLLREFVDFIIQTHFPEINSAGEDKYVEWFKLVSYRNIDMVATWQGFGFTHGVLNTDNTSLLGLTIDYGPFGFLDHYNEHYVPNTSDDLGRYAFNQQPTIILWNLGKLAQAMGPILTDQDKKDIEEFRGTLEEFTTKKVLRTYLLKLGLETDQEGDSELVAGLLDLMQDTLADFTMTFRQLGELDSTQLLDKAMTDEKWSLKKLSDSGDKWTKWVELYRQRLGRENVNEPTRRERMCKVNPRYVPRNWILQEAIQDAENFNFEKVRFLLKILMNPFELNEEAEKRGYAAQPPSWSYGLKLSCSS